MGKSKASKGDVEVLDDFIAKARHLTTLRYTEQLNKPISVSIQIRANVAETSREGPDEEAIQAFLLTLRLFFQDNEEISVRNMAQRIAALPVAANLRDNFLTRRIEMNAYLDRVHGPPQFQIGDGPPISNRQIFEAFTYGKYAHLTQAETVKGWERLVMGEGLRAGYDRVLRRMLGDIVSMAKYAEDIRNSLPS